MHASMIKILAALVVAALAPAAVAQDTPAELKVPDVAGINLEGVDYPFEVKTHSFESQRQTLEMAYMDVAPAEGTEAKGTVLLLHGKNFNGAYFGQTAGDLAKAGYRVVIPDQIGFGKSSKPEHYHYTFHQLAANTLGLLEDLGVDKPVVLGHSMGGMIATRFVLDFPERSAGLVLLNPIGLEDWRSFGVPYQTVEQWYESELKKTRDGIKAYQQESYYDGKWDAKYDLWVDLLAAPLESPDYPRLAWNQALTYDMIFTQPVVYEFDQIEVPTLLIIGTRDRTALGKAHVDDDTRATMGQYQELGKTTAERIPGAEFVELEGVGHLPHIEAYDRFIGPLTRWIGEFEK